MCAAPYVMYCLYTSHVAFNVVLIGGGGGDMDGSTDR